MRRHSAWRPRWLDDWALLIGCVVGIVSGTWMVAELNFASSIFPVTIAGLAVPGYAAVWSLILNIAASMALTALLRLVRAPRASDETSALDYI